MESRNFDHLTRLLGAATTRRTALRALLGGAAAAITGAAFVGDDAGAARHQATCAPGQALCTHHADCCSGTCQSRIVRRGRQRTRVGRCTVPAIPTPEPCTLPTGPNGLCITTPSTTVQACGLNNGSLVPCSSDAECQGADNDPGCGSTFSCYCMTGVDVGVGYSPYPAPYYCIAIPTVTLAVGGACIDG